MYISKHKQQELYNAIHEEIMQIRIVLKDKLNSSEDWNLAQVEHKIWREQKDILDIKD